MATFYLIQGRAGRSLLARLRHHDRPEEAVRASNKASNSKGKAWVRFDDGTDAIVGGSRVER